MEIVNSIVFCLMLGLWRRLHGGLWEDKIKNISRTYMILFFIPYTTWFINSGDWSNWVGWAVGVWISVIYSKGFNDYWDFGNSKPRDKNWFNNLLQKIFPESMWYGSTYDYTGMLLHFTTISLPLCFYNIWACVLVVLITINYAIFMSRGKSEVAEFVFGVLVGLFLVF